MFAMFATIFATINRFFMALDIVGQSAVSLANVGLVHATILEDEAMAAKEAARKVQCEAAGVEYVAPKLVAIAKAA